MSLFQTTIPKDYTRCLNAQCPLRLECLRYTDRHNGYSFVEFQTIDGKCIHIYRPKKSN